MCGATRSGRQRDAEVREQRRAVLQENVLGFDIAVYHPLSMRGVERARHFRRDANGVVNGQLGLPLQTSPKRFPLHVRHYIEEKAIHLAGVVQGQDVGVLEVRRGLDLGQKTLGAKGGDQFPMHHLDRDGAIVTDIVGQIHRGHSAAADLAIDPVPAGEHVGRGGGVAVEK